MKTSLGMLAGFALSAALVAPAAAQPTTLLGVFSNWTAYTAGSGSSMTCYALSKPRASQPRTAKRGPIFLMVSDWPGRKIKGEPQIVYGYQGKEGGAASLGIGGDKFTFFIRNNNKDGSAWLTSLADNQRLVDSMRGGVSAVAKGISQRGTNTTDTYSLAGFNDAMAKIHTACGM